MGEVVVVSYGCIPERVVAVDGDGQDNLLRVANGTCVDDAGHGMFSREGIQQGVYLADGDWEFRLMDLDTE